VVVIRYPKYTGVLLKALDLWYYDQEVTTPILKLMAEIVQNKSQVCVVIVEVVQNSRMCNQWFTCECVFYGAVTTVRK